jgi:hypothetical protein
MKGNHPYHPQNTMTLLEKCLCLAAILFAFILVAALLFVPDLRQPSVLLPLTAIGLMVNVGLMVVVLRDILQRHFTNSTDKYLWLALVLLVWPAILVYLARHGFKAR